jgi:copper homeostasis protein
VRDIALAGLTPPVALVRAIASDVPLPLRVMIRENAGYGTDPSELVRLCRAAAMFADLGVDGLVVGFAREGQLLLDDLREVLQAAPDTPATFHRAFDSLNAPLRSIDALAEVVDLDRVLTDGFSPVPGQSRCARLKEYSDRAGSRLTIIAGGGVDESLLEEIARTRCVREVHVGRAAREGGQESPVTAARVRRLREILNRLP